LAAIAVTYFYLHRAFREKGGDNLQSEHRVWAMTVCSIASILIWVRMLYFALAFQTTGLFVRVVFAVVMDLYSFLSCLTVFLFAFSQGFYIFFHRDFPDSDEVTQHMADEDTKHMGEEATMLMTYQMLFGDYAMSKLSKSPVTLAYYLLFTALVCLTLMNVLIAKMNEAYSRIAESAKSKFSLDLALLVVKLEDTYSPVIKRFRGDRFTTWLVQNKMASSNSEDLTSKRMQAIEGHYEQVSKSLLELKSFLIDVNRKVGATSRGRSRFVQSDSSSLEQVVMDDEDPEQDLSGIMNLVNRDEIAFMRQQRQDTDERLQAEVKDVKEQVVRSQEALMNELGRLADRVEKLQGPCLGRVSGVPSADAGGGVGSLTHASSGGNTQPARRGIGNFILRR